MTLQLTAARRLHWTSLLEQSTLGGELAQDLVVLNVLARCWS